MRINWRSLRDPRSGARKPVGDREIKLTIENSRWRSRIKLTIDKSKFIIEKLLKRSRNQVIDREQDTCKY
ncbi:MAG: hypothetical protein QNJ54_37700 [Prochloraceae cyanobacterium]|nr:hypothetical protein [Prochloraceae cyanobacterium]